MLKDKLKDLAIELLIFSFGLFSLLKIVIHLSETPVRQIINFSTLPIICASAVILLVSIRIAFTVTSIIRYRNNSDASEKRTSSMNVISSFRGWLSLNGLAIIRLSGTILFCVLYAFFLQKINFLVLTISFLVIIFLLYGVNRPSRIIPLSVMGGALVYFIFAVFLKLPL